MSKINLENIAKQMEKVAAAAEVEAVFSRYEILEPAEIIVNPQNIAARNDTPESIKQLADSIELIGLMHPLTVNKIGEHKYVLLSGERRYKAITEHLKWTHIPCTVYNLPDTEQIQIATDIANLEARDYTVSQRLALYKDLDASLRSLKEKGRYKGAIGRAIAKYMGVSEVQVWKYKRLVENYSYEELQQITNINDAIRTLQEPKTLTELKFSEGNTPENDAKTLTELKFSEGNDPENEPKTLTELKFSEGNDPENEPKTLTELKFSEGNDPENEPKTLTELKFSEGNTPEKGVKTESDFQFSKGDNPKEWTRRALSLVKMLEEWARDTRQSDYDRHYIENAKAALQRYLIVLERS